MRYRWYRIGFPNSMTNLSNILESRPLTQNTSFGFISINDELDKDKFRFLWRTSIVVTHLDEVGEPIYDQVESVDFVDFVILKVDSISYLRIENPKRSNKELLNALEKTIGLGFTAKLIVFEKLEPKTLFQHLDLNKLIGLKITGAVIEKNLVASMEFSSKEGIEIDKIKLLEGRQHKIDLANFELVYNGLSGQVTFSSSGLVKITGKLAPKLIHLIEADLAKLTS